MRAAVTLVLLAAACSYPEHIEYPGSNAAPLAVVLSSDPPPAADGTIARDAKILAVLDDLPDPDTAVFGPVLLRSGANNFDADIRADLDRHAVVITPRSLLAANTQYTVVLGGGLRAIDGRLVGGNGVALAISTSGAIANVPAPPPVTWTDVNTIFTGNCTTAGCHQQVVPARRLDFTGSPTDPVFGIINVPSLSTESSALPPLDRVTPGDSARSALVRKLVGGNAHQNSRGAGYPESGVDGERMPLDLAQLPDDQVQLIQRWIDEGAPTQ